MCDYCYNVKEQDATRLSPKGLEHLRHVETKHLKVFGVSVMDRHLPMTDDEITAKARQDQAVEEGLKKPLK